MKIKAITVWQPWASIIAVGYKKIETRPWATEHRGALAIHAAAREPSWIRERLFEAGVDQNKEAFRSLPRGAVVAITTLADCVPITEEFVQALSDEERDLGDYRIGRFAWILENVHPLPFAILAKGRQRLWDWDGKLSLGQISLIKMLGGQ